MQRFLVLATVLALTSQAASAATLERIRDSGAFRMGYRADAKPYSYQNEQGQPAGYLVDLCLEIARALGPDINPQFVRVAAVQRFEAVRDGRVDILCDPSSITMPRREIVNFRSRHTSTARVPFSARERRSAGSRILPANGCGCS